MDIQELQNKHAVFIAAMGWRNSKSPLECTALICEEIGELTHELRQYNIDNDAVASELADIILRAVDLASEMGLDIQAAVERKVRNNMSNIEQIKAKGRRV